ncbi:conserved hypothetical protein [uncultured Desulfobacterium sp.]|uniref:Methionine synthase n=1 Tax=uncultured Desulfobacterium sp. TaxID=201089 RepID=A0A445N030_9BACT|nr:conserved hypothetical protein [uncultured Desulfobacterium sp.]
MPDMIPRYNFLATGIGSVPFLDVESACSEILEKFPLMPFWPQFVRRSYLEDMSVQYSEGLPLLEISKEQRSIRISEDVETESEMTRFYERFLEKDIDYFAISREFAPGLYGLIDLIRQGKGPDGPFIKGQTVGPVTFAAGIMDDTGKPILYNDDLREAMANGLAIKALWQAEILGQSGRKPVIFLDEPYLSGFGSAFSVIQRHEVIAILKTVINYLKENSNAFVGIHCCGNTDWSMLIEAGPDIINFDAYAYMEHFLLYSDSIIRFIERGGSTAWGIVPTSGFEEGISLEGLVSKMDSGVTSIYKWGVSPEILAERSILTPACGMGGMETKAAKTAMNMLTWLSANYRQTSDK